MGDLPIMVSVVCNAYNQEKYIRSALEGFVMQKTTFPFEVLIHDDASTDGTADIIREYEKKYPELIKPIYETENQYSKHDGSLKRIQYGRVQGKYIAMCEGDDYWTDPLKLQKQVDVLEQHPGIDICAHAAWETRKEKKYRLISPSKEETVFDTERVIAGGGSFVATASLMYRSELEQRSHNFRSFLRLDYTLQIEGSLRSGMYFLPDVMGCYRGMADGSWSKRMTGDPTSYIAHKEKVICMWEMLDKDTDFVYHECLQRKIRGNRCNILALKNEYRDLIKNYPDVFKTYSLKKRAYIRIMAMIKG